MELLFPLLMFLMGWFVCWIQMSQSESRKVQVLQALNQQWESKFQRLSRRYVNLNSELLQSRTQLGQLEYQKSLVVGELWRLKNPEVKPQFESQQWQSGYPEARHPDSNGASGQ